MSRLGSLFGDSNDMDSSNALKYSAPKEPKKGTPKQSPPTSADSQDASGKPTASVGGMEKTYLFRLYTL